MKSSRILFFAALLLASFNSWGQEKRKIIIDQDAAGPAGTDQQSMLLLIQSPQVEVLGITVVTGDQWLHEEVAHTLRMLELIGRTDIPSCREPSTHWCAVSRRPSSGNSATVPWPGLAHGRRAFIIRQTS